MPTTTISETDAKRIAVDMNFMSDRKNYSYRSADGRRFFCPVVNRRIPSQGPLAQTLGFMVNENGMVYPTVYLRCIFDYVNPTFAESTEEHYTTFTIQKQMNIPAFDLPAERIEYPNMLAMFEAGWEVD